MFYISLNRIKIMPIFIKSVRVNFPLDDVSGKPFQKWTHTHSFSTSRDCTILTDQVDYNLGGFLSPFFILCYPIFWIMFAMRQYQLKKVFRND